MFQPFECGAGPPDPAAGENHRHVLSIHPAELLQIPKVIAMPSRIESRSNIQLGVVPAHVKFVGGLVPEQGRLPRDGDNNLIVVATMRNLCDQSLVRIDCVQIPIFPGIDPSDVAEMVAGLRALGLVVHFVMMIGNVDPMDPADEDAVVAVLVEGLRLAEENEVATFSSPSLELWMQPGAKRKEGADFDAAVAQNVAVHTRAFIESGVTKIPSWHIEFLRGIEYQTFTDIGRCWKFVAAANESLGKNLFKVLVDAAHCGDSDLSISENLTLIANIAAADELGIFHASAKTTRGCLSTDDGWISALLTACAKTGRLETVFVEAFHHQDAALTELRTAAPGHGIDTLDGRTYEQLVVDGLSDVGRRLNNLVARGVLKRD